jgi:hypothetical protein
VAFGVSQYSGPAQVDASKHPRLVTVSTAGREFSVTVTASSESDSETKGAKGLSDRILKEGD